jgi:hypothetical protein
MVIVPNLANVDPTLTETGSQPRDRSILTANRAAAVMQPQSSACDAASGSPSWASLARHHDR